MFLEPGHLLNQEYHRQGGVSGNGSEIYLFQKNPVLAETHNNIKSEPVKRSIQNWLDNQGIYPQLNSEEEYSKYIEAAYKIADDRRKYFSTPDRRKSPSLDIILLLCLLRMKL